MKRNMYCTIDTETIGGASKPKGVYDFGYIIHDKYNNIAASGSILVMEHYDSVKDDDYAKRNFYLYQERINGGGTTCVATEREALEVLKNICHFYEVKYVIAYNSAFDFCKTCCRELLNDFEFIDIYLMALQTITHLKKYAKFCNEHHFKSSTGKTCSTTAQTVYAFITGNPEYQEEHTALSDAMIEKEIFDYCIKMHKKYTKNCHAFDCQDSSRCFPKMQR